MTEEEHAKLLAGGAVVVGYVPAGCKVIKVGGDLWIEHPDGKQELLPKEKPQTNK